MNDLHHPCKAWAERISLAASGCLSADEEQEVRRHIETCPGCQGRFRQLTELCGTLSGGLQSPTGEAETSIVERVMSAVTSDMSRRPVVRTTLGNDTEMIHPNFLTRSLNKWRWMMRSPVSRVTAVAIFVFAVVGTMLWFQGVGATPAFAEVAKKILDMKSARFHESYKLENVPDDGQAHLTPAAGEENGERVLWIAPGIYRSEHPIDGKSCAIGIVDYTKHKGLILNPNQKYAIVTEYRNGKPGIIEKIQELLRKTKKGPQVESLGKKEIDGHEVIGYRIKEEGGGYGPLNERFPLKTDIWVDSKKLWPVYIEENVTLPNGAVSKTILNQFEYNVEVYKPQFSLKPPADYTVEYDICDSAPGTEKDLISMLREYSKRKDGHFPESMYSHLLWPSIKEYRAISKPEKRLSERQRKELQELSSTLYRGTSFFGSLPVETDAHYAGKGVLFGEAGKPIAWYRPKGAKKYRVIYGDLSVKEMTPEEVKKFPKAEVNEMHKIEEFRKSDGKEGAYRVEGT